MCEALRNDQRLASSELPSLLRVLLLPRRAGTTFTSRFTSNSTSSVS